MTVTYTSYLKIDELLNLQQELSDGPEQDELLFIVIHQVYELWFKQILHEIDFLEVKLRDGDTPAALHTMKRVRTILKTMVSQIDILETMTPMSFESFRDRLSTSSGFQSAQFREFECALGKRSPKLLAPHPEGSPARMRIEARMDKPSLYATFLEYLRKKGDIPQPAKPYARDESTHPDEKIQDALLEVYKSAPVVSLICELLVDIDEGIQEWRYRHVKMVERTIGAKIGTGGSAGAEYLRKTLFTPLFPDLWAIRSRF